MRTLLALALALPLAAQPEPPAEHAAAIAAWGHEGGTSTMLAPAADLWIYDSYRQERGPDFHPYYAVGDFDRDGVEDFAAIVVGPEPATADEARLAWVVIFDGDADGRFRGAYARFIDTYEGDRDAYRGLMFARDPEGHLSLIVPETDAGAQVFVPFRDGYAVYDEPGL